MQSSWRLNSKLNRRCRAVVQSPTSQPGRSNRRRLPVQHVGFTPMWAKSKYRNHTALAQRVDHAPTQLCRAITYGEDSRITGFVWFLRGGCHFMSGRCCLGDNLWNGRSGSGLVTFLASEERRWVHYVDAIRWVLLRSMGGFEPGRRSRARGRLCEGRQGLWRRSCFILSRYI